VLTSVFVVSGAGGAAKAASAAGKTWFAAVSAPAAKTLVVGTLAVGGAATLAVTLPQRQAERPREGVVADPAKRSASAQPAPRPALIPAPSAVTEPAPAAPAVEPAPLPKAEPPAPAPVRELAAPPSSAPGSPAQAVENRRPSLSEELAVLREAQARLNSGDGKGALRLLDETAVAHGSGQLSVERAAVEILAACKAGEVQRADRLARAFLAAHPDVPAAARVRGSCAGEGR
jgi:hypothetical protein